MFYTASGGRYFHNVGKSPNYLSISSAGAEAETTPAKDDDIGPFMHNAANQSRASTVDHGESMHEMVYGCLKCAIEIDL